MLKSILPSAQPSTSRPILYGEYLQLMLKQQPLPGQVKVSDLTYSPITRTGSCTFTY